MFTITFNLGAMQLPPRYSMPCRIQASQASMVPGLVIGRLKAAFCGHGNKSNTTFFSFARGAICHDWNKGSCIHFVHSLISIHYSPLLALLLHGDRQQLERFRLHRYRLGVVGCCIHDRPLQTRGITSSSYNRLVQLDFKLFPTQSSASNTRRRPPPLLRSGPIMVVPHRASLVRQSI